MNLFTIELLQAAISLLPLLIAFTLLFAKGLGRYWLLPTLAFLLNTGYRIYELYQAREKADVITETGELLFAFFPSIINILLFLAMLSIQISLLREYREREQAGQPQRLITPPHGPAPEPETESPAPAEESKKKILNPEPASAVFSVDASAGVNRIRVPEDPVLAEEMARELKEVRASLAQALEIAQFNGTLKKPRKKKKVPKKRKRKTG